MVDKLDFSLASYIIGIISIVNGVLSHFSGILLGIVGIVLSKKDKGDLSKKGFKLSIIGIIVSAIILIATIILAYLYQDAFSQLGGLNIPS